jgi:type VI secretion system protein ImpF
MVEHQSKDRLQPSLLDRLIDHHPDQHRESAEERILSRQQLRAAVLRDLTWLFNTTRPEPEPASTRRREIELWSGHSHARNSVLNFGLPAFAGTTKSTLNRAAMEAAIKQAIAAFEPRIDAKTLVVDIRVGSKAQYNSLHLTIRGNMWAQPMPLEMMVTADVDLETGHAQMRDLRK